MKSPLLRSWQISFLALVAVITNGSPINNEPPMMAQRRTTLRKNDPPSRLPKDVTPESYKLEVTVELDKSQFSGHVDITMVCHKITNAVVLNSKDLTIKSYKLKNDQGAEIKTQPMVEIKSKQQVSFQTMKSLVNGKKYTLSLDFNGTMINEERNIGLYKWAYRDANNSERFLAGTMFHGGNARMAFPCFDEPEFKAVFEITLTHGQCYKALSNMPIKSLKPASGNMMESQFNQTKKMSTYLIGFIICDYGYAEKNTKSGKRIRVWADHGKLPAANRAVDFAKKVVVFLEKYFNFPFPLPKLDIISIDDYTIVQHSQWGLITMNTEDMLRTEDVFHETLHLQNYIVNQWIDSLATINWWDNSWLVEGLAMYLGNQAVEHAFGNDVRLISKMELYQKMLRSDSISVVKSLSSPNPYTQEPTALLNQHSDLKGNFLFQMLDYAMGNQNFRKGLQNYLKKYKYTTTSTGQFWQEMAKVVKTFDVKQFIDTWINQPNYPVITIKKRGSSSCHVTATQSRFLSDIIPSDISYQKQINGFEWYVPLTYKFFPTQAQNKESTIWIKTSASNIILIPKKATWLKANVDQKGFYRVNYGDDLWQMIIDQLNNDHKVFNVKERSTFIDDSFALASAGHLNISVHLQLFSYLKDEREYIPLSTVFRHLKYISQMLTSKPVQQKFYKYITSAFKRLRQYVGWSDTGTHHEKELRKLVLYTLGLAGDREIVNGSLKRLKDWKDNNRAVDLHLRETVYTTAIKYGGITEWDFLWNEYNITKNAKNTEEEFRLLHALAATKSQQYQSKLLHEALKPKSIIENVPTFLTKLFELSSSRSDVWKFVVSRFADIVKELRLEYHNLQITPDYFLLMIADNFNEQSDIDKINNLVSSYPNELQGKHYVAQALGTIRSNKKWVETIQKSLQVFLDRETAKLP